jgi:hypothetical protein
MYEIFFPLIQPDALLDPPVSIENIEPGLRSLFQTVAADLSDHDCNLLSSARHAFSDSSTFDFRKWALHNFAINKNHDYTVEHTMAHRYREMTQKPLSTGKYILNLDTLVVSLSILNTDNNN